MAGINLAGAVGMTGKRESIFSDLAPIVQHTGDAIAKSIQESKAKREKEALLKLQKEQEEKIKNADEWDKFVLSKSDLSPELSSPYFKESTEIGKEVMAINANPNIPQAKKQEIIESKKLDIARKYNKYKDDEEAIKYFQTSSNDPTLDVNNAKEFLAGVNNLKTETKDIIDNNTTEPYQETAGVNTVTETTGKVEPQYFSLSADERMKKTPMGLATTFREKIGLVNTTPEETIKSILPEQTWDDIVEGATTNGNTKFKVNKDKQKGAEDLYVYNVTEGASTKGKILKRGYEALAFKKLKEDHQNLTDAEIAELIPKMVEDRAREDYRNIADKKIGAIINDKTTKFSTPKITPTPIAKTPQKMSMLKSTNEYDAKIDEINSSINDYNNILKEGKILTNKTDEEGNAIYRPILVEERKSYEKAKAFAEKAKLGYEKLSNTTVAGRPDFSGASTTPIEFKLKGKPVTGSIVSPIITDKGELKIELQENYKEKDRGGEMINKSITHLVPLDVDNQQILINNAGDNKNLLRKQIENAKKEAELVKKKYQSKGKNVSSQGKKEGVKEPKKAETKTTKTPTKALGSGRIVYLQADGTYGINDPNKK